MYKYRPVAHRMLRTDDRISTANERQNYSFKCFSSMWVGEKEMSALCGAASDPDGHVLVVVYNLVLSAIITVLMKKQLLDHTYNNCINERSPHCKSNWQPRKCHPNYFTVKNEIHFSHVTLHV